MKELLLYGPMYNDSVARLITELDEAAGSDAVIRLSTNGGSPEATFGVIAKMTEFSNNILMKVDGKAQSSGAFLVCYADDSEALDVTEFMFHRASYPEWIERDPDLFTDALKGNLERLNANLRKALEAKVDVKKFERFAKMSLDELFSMESRKEVFLTSAQAKACGLISRINKITPKIRAEIDALADSMDDLGFGIAAEFKPKPTAETEPESTKPDHKMNIEEFKAKHPELYAQVRKESADETRDQIGAWLGFVDVNPKRVVEAIKKGEKLSQTEMVELTRASLTKAATAGAEGDSPADTVTDPNAEGAETEAKKKEKADMEAFMAEVNGDLKLEKAE